MSTINLLPQDYIQRRSQARPNLICTILFAIVIAAIGGAALVSERRSKSTRAVCDRINASYEQAARLIQEMHELEAQKRTMLGKAEMSAALMERLPRSYVLAMLANALPEGASLTSTKIKVSPVVERDKQAAPQTKHGLIARSRGTARPVTPKLAVSVNLIGAATTDVQVARFIANLAKNPLTELVDLAYSRETRRGKEKVREFSLIVRLKPSADALDGLPQVIRAEETAAAEPVSQGGGA
jgi:Tfp pilus assembly protein PilN